MDDRPTAATTAQILRTASDESSDVIERAENSLEEASEQPRRRRRRRKEISKEKSSKDALGAPQSRSKSPEKAQKRGEPEGNNTKAPAQDAFLVVEPAGKAESSANLVVQSKTPKMEHDWIISTHPEKKQKMRIAEEKKSKKLDDSHWIIQTQHGEHPSARTPHLPHEISPQTPEQSSKDSPYKDRKKKSRERHRKKREDKEKKNKSEERMLKALYGKERSKEKAKKPKKPADASEATTAVPWSATKTPDPTPPERRLAKTAQEPTPPVQEQTPQKSADPSPPAVQQPSDKTPTKDPSLVQPRKPKFSADERRPSMIQFLNVADRQDTPPHTPQQNTPIRTPLSKEFYIPSKEPEAEPEMQPGTTASELKLARKPKAHHISYFDLQFRRSQQEAAEKAAAAARAERASSGGSVVSRRRRSEHLLKATTSKSSLQMSAEVSKSVSRIRFKSARIRARRKLRHWSRYKEEGIKPTEEKIYADHVIRLTPLKAPISIDSRRCLTRNCDQVNLRQVLRIYGSGKVVEPFDSIPRRTSVRCTRGMATVKYGRNMIEITFQNTDIQAEKRSRVGTWIFSHAKWVRTMPIVFGKTWIGAKGPAPFCLSVGAPFWVTAHQEQVASSRSGERIRDCIEIRSCFGSESPCYEMQALETEKHPLFNERIYLGRADERLRPFFSDQLKTSTLRRYRINIPWRTQEGDSVPRSIPRAPQIEDIKTTVRKSRAPRPATETEGTTADTKDTKNTKKTKKKGKEKKRKGRRRLPPRTQDTFNVSSQQIQCQDDTYKIKRQLAMLARSTTSLVTAPMDMTKRDDSDSVMEQAFLPERNRMRESKTAAGYGVVTSSREHSPEQHSFREVIEGAKESELETVAKLLVKHKATSFSPFKPSTTEPPTLVAPKKENSEHRREPESHRTPERLAAGLSAPRPRKVTTINRLLHASEGEGSSQGQSKGT
ncbi:hypothetical protein Q1695_004084 [Nippostrongylus brasiliensis]|nr:hypothetical protein Q1695_004084 [Nippostrongylus brasiliensis]